MVTGLNDSGLRKTLAEVGGILPEQVEAFIFGGGAMVFRNQKAATKDVDVVFRSKAEATGFVEALKSLGYKQDSKLATPYELMEAGGGIWLRPDSRFDVFINKICGALAISPTVIKRSQEFQRYGEAQHTLVL